MKPRLFSVIQNWTPLAILFFSILIFREQLFGNAYTKWDTFDAYTVNFTYFSDSIRAGIFPFWNPFVMSGVSTLANSFTYVLYSPIDLMFLIVSQILDPIFCVELQILLAFIVFGCGFFYLYRSLTGRNDLLGLVISLVAAITICFPIIGQIGFLFSMCSFPWILYFCEKILKDNKLSKLEILLSGFLCSLLVAKGYYYFNAMNLFFSIIYIAIGMAQKRENLLGCLQKFIIFSIAQVSIFLVLLVHSYLDVLRKYQHYSKDFSLPEPRLRSIAISERSSYSGFLDSLGELFIPKEPSAHWLMGLGILTFVLLITLLRSRKYHIKIATVFFSASMFLLGIFFSYDSFLAVMLRQHSDVFSSFRWLHTNLYYSEFAFFLAFCSLEKKVFTYENRSTLSNVFIVVLLLETLLCLPSNELGPLEKNLLGIRESKKNEVIGSRSDFDSATNFTNRKILPITNRNFRKLNNKKEFEYSDISWLLSKSPISHGYLNTIDPLYWSIKDSNILSVLVYATREIPDNKISDEGTGEITNSRYDEITSSFHASLCSQSLQKACLQVVPISIEQFYFSPNLIRIKSSSDSNFVLNINNQFSPNWQAVVNGELSPITKTNLLFQSIKVPKGIASIELRYTPKEVWPIVICYLVWCLFISFYLVRITKKRFQKIATSTL